MCWHNHGWVDGQWWDQGHRVIWNGRFFKIKVRLPYETVIYLEQWPTKSENGSPFLMILIDSSLVYVPNFMKPVYTVVAFTPWPRVAVKSTLLWPRTSFLCFPMIPSVAYEWRLPAATRARSSMAWGTPLSCVPRRCRRTSGPPGPDGHLTSGPRTTSVPVTAGPRTRSDPPGPEVTHIDIWILCRIIWFQLMLWMEYIPSHIPWCQNNI